MTRASRKLRQGLRGLHSGFLACQKEFGAPVSWSWQWNGPLLYSCFAGFPDDRFYVLETMKKLCTIGGVIIRGSPLERTLGVGFFESLVTKWCVAAARLNGRAVRGESGRIEPICERSAAAITKILDLPDSELLR